jgi:hydrogenase-4 component F
MIALYLTLAIPLISIPIMAMIGHYRLAGKINFAITSAGFIAAVFLLKTFLTHGNLLSPTSQYYLDAFNISLILLTTFIGMTTAWFSVTYMEHSIKLGRLSPGNLRLYYSMYQAFMFSMLLALLANNIGILWVSLEAATLTTVPLVSLYRSPESVEAAWKYFILCIVGIALALFGTVLLYFSAQKITGNPSDAILWTMLYSHANLIDPAIFSIAFIFLLVGYGTKIGLVPLHNWLPDAHSESPAPMSALLSGLLLNMGLYALIRFKIIGNLVLNNHLISYTLMGFGLLSFLFAAVMLHRQRNIKRLYSYSSIEHMGLMTFALLPLLPYFICWYTRLPNLQYLLASAMLSNLPARKVWKKSEACLNLNPKSAGVYY